jgi:hypothetical protein
VGYTHYWRAKNDGPIPAPAWDKICEDAKNIIARSTVPVQLEYDEAGPVVINGDAIRLNGVGDAGHETFLFERNLDDFTFCKTAQKPYDVIVTAILACAVEHAPEYVRVSSDGGEEDWSDGIDLATEATGRPVPCPILHDGDDED